MKSQLVAVLMVIPLEIVVSQEIKDLPLKTILNTISPSENPSWVHDENATLLDIFGEVAKDILTNQMIPGTEEKCDWNWMHLRCEPFCDCSYLPLWGDYHLGRSCRARSENENDGYKEEDSEIRHACGSPPNTRLYKGMNRVRGGMKFILKAISWKRRVGNARKNVCDSLRFEDSTLEDDEQNVGSKHFILEIPVRALRKSLHCNELNVETLIDDDDNKS